MKIFLASAIAIILTTSIFATVEDATKLAMEQISVLEAHMITCEYEGYNNGLIIDYRYHNGYVHGARDAYINILKKINQTK